jgi:4-amino-4-deoxy-L-arabinose transferase-like glycosyltransferase
MQRHTGGWHALPEPRPDLIHRADGVDRGTTALAAVALVATVLCHVPLFRHTVIDIDEASYASVAAMMNAGGTLYGDGGVDIKFPGNYYTYAIVFRVFGRFAMHAVHAVALCFVLATLAVLAAIGRRLGSARAGWLAALLYGVFKCIAPKMLAANTEAFMMLPLAASVLLTLELADRVALRRLFYAGALVAVATLWKQVAALNVALVCVAALAARRHPLPARIRGAACAAAGFLAVLAVAALGLARVGALGGMLHWSIERVVVSYGADPKRLHRAFISQVPWGDNYLSRISYP